VVRVVQIASGFDGAAKLESLENRIIVPLLWPLFGGQSQLGPQARHARRSCD
jgi:hypothetical protein